MDEPGTAKFACLYSTLSLAKIRGKSGPRYLFIWRYGARHKSRTGWKLARCGRFYGIFIDDAQILDCGLT